MTAPIINTTNLACKDRKSFLLLRKEETIFKFKEESAKGGFPQSRPLWKPLLNRKVTPQKDCLSA